MLSDSGAAANSNLATGTNSAADQPYTVSYDGAGIMTLSTFYADKGPDVDKPYIITIDTHNTVRYIAVVGKRNTLKTGESVSCAGPALLFVAYCLVAYGTFRRWRRAFRSSYCR